MKQIGDLSRTNDECATMFGSRGGAEIILL